MTQSFKIDSQLCSQLLTDLFFDLSGFISSPEYNLIVIEKLPKIFLILLESLEDFLVVRESAENEGRIRTILKNEFSKLESI